MKPARIAALLCALLVFLGVDVQSELTFRARKASAAKHQKLRSAERYVDLSAVVRVVERDGDTMVNGRPKLRVLRDHVRGGLFDTLTKKWAGPALNPVVLTCSVHQEAAILHEETEAVGMWLQGGKGSGKSTAGCYWLTLQIIKHAPHPLQGAGVTAPTDGRMEAILKILVGPKGKNGERKNGLWPHAWYAWREGDRVAVMASGLSIDFVSGHVSNASEGSRIQGQNWGFSLNDEIQDYHSQDIEIVMRGRAAWNSRYERCATATPKPHPAYRQFRDRIHSNATDWKVWHLRGPDSPFVGKEQWERVARTTTADQYAREALGEDTPSENRTYLQWDREQNLRPLQEVPRWTDVTARELEKYGRGFSVLVGTDPGRRHNVSILLKAYQPPIPAVTRANPQPRIPLPAWFVVGEVTTTLSEPEHHCRALLDVLRKQWGCNIGGDGPRALVRMDPMAKGPNDTKHPDQRVYRVFESFGLYTKAAAYRVRSTAHSWVPIEARISMVNILMCNSVGERRLFIACDHAKTPAAPRLVSSIEQQERDGNYDAEKEGRKGQESDISHWTAALGYALWSVEKGRTGQEAAA